MKHFLFILILLSVMPCLGVADELILSDKQTLDYPKPVLISHGGSELIIKYDNWWFSHEVVNPKNIYSFIDFSGFEHSFIRSLFDSQFRVKQTGWLRVLAEEQAKELGVKDDNIVKKNMGDAELFAVYNTQHNTGRIYILEKLKIHDISVHGTEDKFNLIINNIEKR